MGVQERAKNRERVDKDEKIKELQATILAYSEAIENLLKMIESLDERLKAIENK